MKMFFDFVIRYHEIKKLILLNKKRKKARYIKNVLDKEVELTCCFQIQTFCFSNIEQREFLKNSFFLFSFFCRAKEMKTM